VLGTSSGSAYDGLFTDSFYFGDFDEYNSRSDSITLGHGNAVAHNIAVQTIDPWPRYVGNSRIDIDGERLMIGVARYKANKSLQPKSLATQDLSFTKANGASNTGN
jgi:hypothetical protein